MRRDVLVRRAHAEGFSDRANFTHVMALQRFRDGACRTVLRRSA
jgi:hypothetical protein